MTARSVRHTPSRLTASVRSTCSTGAVASAPVKAMPALAIATSIAAEALDGGRDRPLERVEVGDVGLEASSRGRRGGRRSRSQPLGLEADERDVRALRVQALGGRRADAARGAGDEHGASVHVVWGGLRAADRQHAPRLPW